MHEIEGHSPGERMDVVTGRSLIQRMIGAAKLDIHTFDEVKRDESATVQAAAVVTIVAMAQAIGAASEGGPGIVGGLVPAFAGWILWSGVAYLVGNGLLGGTATWGELLRTLGFAQAPSLLGVLGIVPGVSGWVDAVVGVWLLITGVVAIRRVFRFGIGTSIGIAIGGWIIAHVPIVLIHQRVG